MSLIQIDGVDALKLTPQQLDILAETVGVIEKSGGVVKLRYFVEVIRGSVILLVSVIAYDNSDNKATRQELDGRALLFFDAAPNSGWLCT